MKILFNRRDAASATLKVTIEKADYAAQVDKNMRDMRKKAIVPGFRKGTVPLDRIRRSSYGREILTDELDKILSKSVSEYTTANNISTLGEALMDKTEQKEIDFDAQEEFEFCLEIALMPEINLSLSKSDTLPYYRLIITDEMVEEQVALYRKEYGADNQPAELTQELFDKVFGEGAVTDKAQFYAKVKEKIEKRAIAYSEQRWQTDVWPFLLQKAGELPLADNILKRQLFREAKNKTMEQIEVEYPARKDAIKYSLIKWHIAEKNHLTPNEAEMQEVAVQLAASHIVNSGTQSVTKADFSNYVGRLLNDSAILKDIANQIIERKIAQWLKQTITLDVRFLSREEFEQLL